MIKPGVHILTYEEIWEADKTLLAQNYGKIYLNWQAELPSDLDAYNILAECGKELTASSNTLSLDNKNRICLADF